MQAHADLKVCDEKYRTYTKCAASRRIHANVSSTKANKSYETSLNSFCMKRCQYDSIAAEPEEKAICVSFGALLTTQIPKGQ